MMMINIIILASLGDAVRPALRVEGDKPTEGYLELAERLQFIDLLVANCGTIALATVRFLPASCCPPVARLAI